MDPLSDVLSLLHPRSYFSAGLDAGGAWAIRFPAYEGIKFNAIVTGDCWLTVEGVPAPVHLDEGDCFLLSSGKPFNLASDLSLEPIEADAIYSVARDGIAQCNGGGDFLLMGSRFGFSRSDASILLDMLPPIVHVRRSSDHASVLRWSLDRITRELRDQQPGGVLMTEHLAHVMLLQVIRLHVTAADAIRTGWLFALGDRHMKVAIGAIHADPARRWTVADLARSAGLSRSVFAIRFRATVGVTPMEYLAHWRMNLARDRLTDPHDSIGAIGRSLGFASESAFGAAFKRVMGCSPRQYGRRVERDGPVSYG